MEQLISFVMDNLGIVVIVVGIIYAMFFRKSPLERPPNRMPDFGGGGQRRPGQPGEGRPPVAQSTRPAPEEPRFPPPQRQELPPVTRQQPVRVETREPGPKPASPRPVALAYGEMDERPTGEERTSQVTERVGAEVLNRDDLSRAVMWAEILGPPRARRPHRR